MRLEEAIAILKYRADGGISMFPWKDEKAASALGVEALKRLQDNRRDPEFDHWILLPGETQEELEIVDPWPTVAGLPPTEDACTAKDS